MRPPLKKILGAHLAIVLACTTVGAHAQADRADDANQKATYAYVLTMDKVNKLAEIRSAIGKWRANNEQVSKRMDKDKALIEGTFTRRAKVFDDNYPDLAAIVREKGVSTNEYLLASHVLFRALMLVGAKKAHEIRDYSEAGPGVNPVNLRFVEQHLEEISKSMRDIRFSM